MTAPAAYVAPDSATAVLVHLRSHGYSVRVGTGEQVGKFLVTGGTLVERNQRMDPIADEDRALIRLYRDRMLAELERRKAEWDHGEAEFEAESVKRSWQQYRYAADHILRCRQFALVAAFDRAWGDRDMDALREFGRLACAAFVEGQG